MDQMRMSRAAHRLWGRLDENEVLHAAPRFAAELAARCHGTLELRADAVSGWSFGQQLEHLYRTSHYVLDHLSEAMASDGSDGRMNLLGHALMTAGFIPRGLFKVIPELRPTTGNEAVIRPLKDSLEARLGSLEWSLRQINAHNGRSRHPRMRHLLANQWLFFLDVHHRHHLAIMHDLVTAAGKAPGVRSAVA
ncbi:MAG TPA: hypothetical protein VE075_11420 [Thermoanaerobaculia bacterium]|nr:hypothetical protein [Thermoanaerobaculia bacterium]